MIYFLILLILFYSVSSQNISIIWYGRAFSKNIEILDNYLDYSPKLDQYYIMRKYKMDDYYLGYDLSDKDITDIIIPSNVGNIYILLADYKVNLISGICEKYCSKHFSYKNNTYIIIGNPLRCLNRCSNINSFNTPNRDIEMDSIIDLLNYELSNIYIFDKEKLHSSKDSWIYKNISIINNRISNTKIGNRKYLLHE